MSHEDVDVRRVAKGLEYIYTAPQLDLGEEYFQWIDLEKIGTMKLTWLGLSSDTLS